MTGINIVTIKVEVLLENKGSDTESRWSNCVNTLYIYILSIGIVNEYIYESKNGCLLHSTFYEKKFKQWY